MTKKHQIKSVQDIKHCEEKCLTIYSKTEDCFYEFYNGIWCRYDKKGYIRVYNATLYFDSELYYEEESEEQQEATAEDVGKLCWFWDVDDNKFIEVLAGYDKDSKTPYECGAGWYNRYCRPLTKAEIQEFMEKAE